MITVDFQQRVPLAFLVILLGVFQPFGSLAQDQAGRFDVLKGTDGQSACQLRGTVHEKCSTLPTPGLDSSPLPTVCTCNNVYFNIWSACSYASGNNTLPMFGAWTKTCTDASVDLSKSEAMTTQNGALGIQVPEWGKLMVPGNAAFDLQQAVAVQLAQRKQWSIFQIVLPIVAGIVAVLITLLAMKIRRKGPTTIRWRPNISALLPYSTRVRTFEPSMGEGWEIDPPPSRVSTQNVTPADSVRHPHAHRPTSFIIDNARRNNRESTEPGHPSVPSYGGSDDGNDSPRQSHARDSGRPPSQALAAMYPFGPEAHKPFTATPVRSQSNSSNDLGTITPNSTDVSSGTIQAWLPKGGIRLPHFLRKTPVAVRNVRPQKDFNIDGPGSIASRSTSITGSSFSATGAMKTMHANKSRVDTMTGTEIDPIHEDDGESSFHDLGGPHSHSGSFDDNESTNLISRMDRENSVMNIGNDDDGHGSESRSAVGSVSVNSHIKIVSPSVSTASRRYTGDSLQSPDSGLTAPPIPRLPPPPVPPVPNIAAPIPPVSGRTPLRRTMPGSAEAISPPNTNRFNMAPIREDVRLDSSAVIGSSRRPEGLQRSRPLNQNPTSAAAPSSTATGQTQRQIQPQPPASTSSWPLPQRSGSVDSTNSFNTRPLPSPANSYSQSHNSQNHGRSASQSALQVSGSSHGNSSTSIGTNHVRSMSNDPQHQHPPYSAQTVFTSGPSNDPLRSTPTQQNFLHSHGHSGSSSSSNSGLALVRSFSPLNLYEDPYATHHRGLSDDTGSFYMPETPMQPQHSRSGTPRNDAGAFYAGPVRGAGYGGVG